MVRIVCLQAVDMRKERLGCKGVNAGVDLAGFLLGFGKRFLLHNCFYAIAARACANHAAIAEGIGRLSGKNRHGGLFGQMKVAHARNGFRAD